nr:MAG: hypothetical protein [Chemarfal virus 66]
MRMMSGKMMIWNLFPRSVHVVESLVYGNHLQLADRVARSVAERLNRSGAVRRALDLVLPGGRVLPWIGWERKSYSGPPITGFVVNVSTWDLLRHGISMSNMTFSQEDVKRPWRVGRPFLWLGFEWEPLPQLELSWNQQRLWVCRAYGPLLVSGVNAVIGCLRVSLLLAAAGTVLLWVVLMARVVALGREVAVRYRTWAGVRVSAAEEKAELMVIGEVVQTCRESMFCAASTYGGGGPADEFDPAGETVAQTWAHVQHSVLAAADLVKPIPVVGWTFIPPSGEETVVPVWRDPVDLVLGCLGVQAVLTDRLKRSRKAAARGRVRSRLAKITFLTEAVRMEKPGLRNISANRLLLSGDIIPRVLKQKCPSLRLCSYKFYCEAILACYWQSDETSELLRKWAELCPREDGDS